MRRAAVAWGPAVLWALCLFLLSEIRAVPSALQPLWAASGSLGHFALYLVLGGLLARARSVGGVEAPHGVLLALGLVYAALDEWHQSFVPGRTPELADWWADAAGVAVGYFVVGLAGREGPPEPEEVDQQ